MDDEIMASVEQIHGRLLDMAKAVAAVLERHGIPYSLAYGTLLGGVRHSGFIPWDDDFDLWLFDDTYDAAIECLRAELSDDMFLEDSNSEPKYFHAWAHVKDLNTVVSHNEYPHDDSYAHHGLSLDLYRLWKMKECDLQNFLNEENRRYIMRRRKLSLMSDEEYKTRMKKLEDDERCTENDASQEEIYGLLNIYKCKKMPVKYVFPLIKYKFEDSEFYGIQQADKFLTDIYGDWRTLPPENERKGHGKVLFKKDWQ